MLPASITTEGGRITTSAPLGITTSKTMSNLSNVLAGIQRLPDEDAIAAQSTPYPRSNRTLENADQ